MLYLISLFAIKLSGISASSTGTDIIGKIFNQIPFSFCMHFEWLLISGFGIAASAVSATYHGRGASSSLNTFNCRWHASWWLVAGLRFCILYVALFCLWLEEPFFDASFIKCWYKRNIKKLALITGGSQGNRNNGTISKFDGHISVKSDSVHLTLIKCG